MQARTQSDPLEAVTAIMRLKRSSSPSSEFDEPLAALNRIYQKLVDLNKNLRSEQGRKNIGTDLKSLTQSRGQPRSPTTATQNRRLQPEEEPSSLAASKLPEITFPSSHFGKRLKGARFFSPDAFFLQNRLEQPEWSMSPDKGKGVRSSSDPSPGNAAWRRIKEGSPAPVAETSSNPTPLSLTYNWLSHQTEECPAAVQSVVPKHFSEISPACRSWETNIFYYIREEAMTDPFSCPPSAAKSK